MMSAVQWELTLEKVAEWRDKKDDLPLAYGMLLVQISWGFGAVPADLESFIGSTGCSVARVLRRCPILQVRSWCVREASLGLCVVHATDWTALWCDHPAGWWGAESWIVLHSSVCPERRADAQPEGTSALGLHNVSRDTF